MLPYIFDHPFILISGLVFGIIIGFLLQKGRISQFTTIVGQFLLQDFTLLKMILTAIIVGSIGIQLLLAIGLPVEFPVTPWSAFATIIGALVLGAGIAILGYCPGTCAAAAGQGSNDAWWGLFGMILGAAVYSETYSLLQKSIHSVWIVTKGTLPEVFYISPWIIIAILSGSAMILFKLLGRR